MNQAAIEASKARSAVKRESRERQRAMDIELKQFHNNRVQDMVKRNGVSFVHVRDYNYEGQYMSRGGATVAWHRAGPNRIVASVAQCHPKDHYCKWMGRSVACRAMREGDSIQLTVPKNKSVPEVLYRMFKQVINHA
jgi:hypothetical protein